MKKEACFTILGMYNSLERQELESNVNDGKNMYVFLNHHGIKTVSPSISVEDWLCDEKRREVELMINDSIKKSTDVLFLRTRNTYFRDKEYAFAINHSKKVWCMSDLKMILDTYAAKNKKC